MSVCVGGPRTGLVRETILATVLAVCLFPKNVRVTRALPLGGVSSYLDVFDRVNLASLRLPPREGEIQLTARRPGGRATLLGPPLALARAVAGPRSWAVPCMAHDGLRSFVSRWLGKQPHSRSLPAGKLAALSAL